MTFKNNRAPLLCCFQLCAWFHCHMWIQTGVRVRKRLSWVLTSVTLTFDLWPWPFAWTSLLTMVITPENFMMIRWWEHGEKGVTDGRTDRQTDGQTDGLNQSYSCLVAAKNNHHHLRSTTVIPISSIITIYGVPQPFTVLEWFSPFNRIKQFLTALQQWSRFTEYHNHSQLKNKYNHFKSTTMILS